MRPFVFTVLAIGTAVVVLTSGCGKSLQERIEKAKGNSPADEQRDVAQADEAAQLEYLDEWRAFRSAAEKQIAANAKTMDDLKSKVATTAVEELSLKNKELKERLESYSDEGKVNWDAFKRDFSSDLNGLDKTLKDLDATAGK